MKRFVLVLAALFLLGGCATSGKINAVQVGMTKSDVIAVMGQPVSVSAKDDTEYLNYRLSETAENAFSGVTTPYYVRLVNGIVDSYGRTGDFDSTKNPTVRIETDENVRTEASADLYTELQKLKELFDEGILSQEEYDELKARVLDKY